MSLEGGKLICLDEAGNHGEILEAKSRKFTIGYYGNSDIIINDKRALGTHCEIVCDAFGRVTIRNFSTDNPILVNGSIVEIKRMLLNNSKLLILDKEYLWQFPKSSSHEFEDMSSAAASSTPAKQIGIPEQPPNSCPDLKLHRELPKRFTVHNFAYCIQSDEEGNTSTDSNEENSTEDNEENQNIIENKEKETNQKDDKDSNGNTDSTRNRSVTPEPPPTGEKDKSSSASLLTPKMNLINCTKNKENKSTQKKNKQQLTLCHQSDVVITSFSPRETGVKVEKSFTAIVKPKVLVTKPPTTPKSVYSTPKSDMNDGNEDDGDDDDDEKELTNFHTPSTSKKATGTGTSTATKVLKNSSMHLVDLTTPNKLRPASPYLKSALKASTKKNLPQAADKSSVKLQLDEQLGLSALPSTPVVSDSSNCPLETPNSVISVSSSTDTSSVVEVTSDGSNLGITPSSDVGLSTPTKPQTRTGACTPKRTPQSLMKRALLTSAKKQAAATTPQRATNSATTPRREPINRIPLRSNLALLRSPVTPKAATDTNSPLPRRQSMSTPSRKSLPARNRFDNSPSTSGFGISSPSSSTSLASRRSSINPISAARALPTSTPVTGLRNRSACKTSPLHKVRKSVGGIPLSSHISKTRRSIALPASTSKLTSVKEKSPQQVMSNRLVSRARKSLCVTPISTRARDMVAAAKTPPPVCPSSILKDTQSERKPPEHRRKAVLFADKQPADDNEVNDLSRTFIVDSDEETDTAEDKKKDETHKVSTTINTTFSPEKKTDDEEKVQTDLQENLDEDVIKTPEIPVDVEEVIRTKVDSESVEKETENPKANNAEGIKQNVSLKHNDESEEIINEKTKENNDEMENKVTAVESITETKEQISQIAEGNNDNNKSVNLVTEESFAEIIINDSQESIEDKSETIEINDSPRESFAEVIDDDNTQENDKEDKDNSKEKDVEITDSPKESFAEVIDITKEETVEDNTQSDIINEAEVVETDFAEESAVEILEISNSENPLETKTEKANDSVIILTEEEKKEDEEILKKNLIKDTCKNIDLVSEIAEEKTNVLEEKEINKDECKENMKERKSDVYKPIYEDITLEGSIIEKEEERNLEGSIVAEENIQNEQTEDQTPKESIIVEQLDLVESKVGGEVENQKNETKNISHEIVEQLEQEPTNINEKIDEENANTNPEKSQIVEQFEVEDVNESIREQNIEKAVDENVSKDSEIIHSLIENDDLENTSKLLEEIEDVLNKSDEIKQKHLDEMQKQNSETPLTEEFESEKLSQDTISSVSEKSEEEHSASNETNNSNKVEDAQKESEIIATQEQEITDDNIETRLSPEIENQSQENLNQSREIVSEETVGDIELQTVDNVGETDSLNSDKIESKSEENSEVKSQENVQTDKQSQEIISQTQEVVSQEYSEDSPETEIQSLEIVSETESKSEETVADIELKIVDNIEETDSLNDENSEVNSQENIQTDPQSQDTEIKSQTQEIVSQEITETERQPEDIVVEEPKSNAKEINAKTESQEIVTETESLNIKKTDSNTQETSETDNVSEAEPQSEETAEINNEKETGEPMSETNHDGVTLVSSIKNKIENVSTLTPRRSIRRASRSAETPTTSQDVPTEMPSVSSIKKKMETNLTPRRGTRRSSAETTTQAADTTLTPRRTTRRTSLSTETSTQSVETTTLTPKRSTRRSMSAEPTNTYTPTKKVTRRSSLSAVSEAPPLTPKRITSRRSSIDEDASKTVLEPKTPRAKTPRKQLEQRSVIPEEIEENMDAIIEEEEEPTAEKATNNEEYKMEETVAQVTLKSEKKENTKQTDDSENNDNAKETEDKENEDLNTVPVLEKVSGSEENKTNQDTVADEIPETEKKEIVQETDISNTKDAQEELAPAEDYAASKDDSISKEHDEVDKAVLLEQDVQKDDTINDIKEIPFEDVESAEIYDDECEELIPEYKETTTPKVKKTVQIDADSPKTPLMSGMRELLKTPKPENTPRFGGLRNLVRTPKIMQDNEEEETEKLADVANLVKTPRAEVSETLEEIDTKTTKAIEISTPKTKKSVKIVADSPKTPVMAGVRELFKTPKAELNTPRLGGIRHLVRTPKTTPENEKEEMEKLAVVAELVKTPQVQISDEDLPTTSTNVVEISTPKVNKSVQNVADSPKTPKITTENEEEEMEKLEVVAELVKTPEVQIADEVLQTTSTKVIEISTPKTKKSVKIVADSPKTPVLAGVRKLLKTPKPELNTPRLCGIRDLVRTPKITAENEEEEMDKLAAVAELVKTPGVQISDEDFPTTSTKVIEISTPKTKKSVKIVADSPKTPVLAGVRKLLKTPKPELNTPRLCGIRDLVRTPKITAENEEEEMDKLAAVAELVKTPQIKISLDADVEELEEIPTTSAKETHLTGVKELLKTPKSCSTPRFKGMRELMQTPKMCSTPLMGGIKELMVTPTQRKHHPDLSNVEHENFDKFLKTPTAKNIMISTMPSSAIIEKSTDSIEVSTEYDLNATHEGDTANLEELFKTPVASRFVERITASYYGEEDEEHDDNLEIINKTENEQLDKAGEEDIEKTFGQESLIETPMRKSYSRKSLALRTPQAESPFSSAEVLSDLPKADVQEWIENLEQPVLPPTILEDNNEEVVELDKVNESIQEIPEEEVSCLEDSVVEEDKNITIPETCAKVYLSEKSLANVTTTSEVMLNLSTIEKTNSKDPLANTTTKIKAKETRPVTPVDAEISGINLLDETFESVQNEPSMLDEPLFVEEPSMFEEHLLVSDNESEVDTTIVKEIKEEQDSLANKTLDADEEEDANDLSEPLLVSDSEDLNNSQDENELDEENALQNENNKVGEKSMLVEEASEEVCLTKDPLEDNDDEVKEKATESNEVEVKPELSMKNVTTQDISENNKSAPDKESITEITAKDVETTEEVSENVKLVETIREVATESEEQIVENIAESEEKILDDVLQSEEKLSEDITKSKDKMEVESQESEEIGQETNENIAESEEKLLDDVLQSEEKLSQDITKSEDKLEVESQESEETVQETNAITGAAQQEPESKESCEEINNTEASESTESHKELDASSLDILILETSEIVEEKSMIDEECIDEEQTEDIVKEEDSSLGFKNANKSTLEDSKKQDQCVIDEEKTKDSEVTETSVIEENPSEDCRVEEISVNELNFDSIVEDSFTETKNIETSKSEEISSTNELEATKVSTKISETVKPVDDTAIELSPSETEISESEKVQKLAEKQQVSEEETSDKENMGKSEMAKESKKETDMESEDIFLDTSVADVIEIEEATENNKTAENIIPEEVSDKINEAEIIEVPITETINESDIFVDTSAVEEENAETSNEPAGKLKSSKTTEKVLEQECDDIFMDSSIAESAKADESFADEATNDEKDVENESAMVEVTTKEKTSTNADIESVSLKAVEESKNTLSEELLETDSIKLSEQSSVNESGKKDENPKNVKEVHTEISTDNEEKTEDDQVTMLILDEAKTTDVTDETEDFIEETSKTKETEIVSEKQSKEEISEQVSENILDSENSGESVEKVQENTVESNDILPEDLLEPIEKLPESISESQESHGVINETEQPLNATTMVTQEEPHTTESELAGEINDTDESQNLLAENPISEIDDKDTLENSKELESSIPETKDQTEDIVEAEPVVEEKSTNESCEPKTTSATEDKSVLLEESKTNVEETETLSQIENSEKATQSEPCEPETTSATEDKSVLLEESKTNVEKTETLSQIEDSDKTTQNEPCEPETTSAIEDKSVLLEESKTNVEETETLSQIEDSEKTKVTQNEPCEPETTSDPEKTEVIEEESASQEIEFKTTEVSSKKSSQLENSEKTVEEESTSLEIVSEITEVSEKLPQTEESERTIKELSQIEDSEKTEIIQEELSSQEIESTTTKKYSEKNTEEESSSVSPLQEIVSEISEESGKLPQTDESTSLRTSEEIVPITETTEKTQQESTEKVETLPTEEKSTTEVEFNKAATEDETTRTSTDKPAEIEIVKTYDFEVKINDIESQIESEPQSETTEDHADKPTSTKRGRGRKGSQSSECSNADLELPTTRRVRRNTKTEEKATVQTADDVQELTNKRGRRKPTVSESSQGSVHEDETNATSRKGRKAKLQMAPVEEAVLENIEENKEQSAFVTELNEELIGEEDKEDVAEENIVEEEDHENAIKEKTKTSRRKRNASESSQGSAHDDDNVCSTRRGRRKVQTTIVEEQQENEDLPTGSNLTTIEEEHIKTTETIKKLRPEIKDIKEIPTVSLQKETEEATDQELPKEQVETKDIIEDKKDEHMKVEQLKLTENSEAVTQNLEIEPSLNEKLGEQIAQVSKETDILTDVVEEAKENAVKRGIRKPTVSESSQDSTHDDTSHKRKGGRRKVQQTPIEETHVEENQINEEPQIISTAHSNEQVETTDIPVENLLEPKEDNKTSTKSVTVEDISSENTEVIETSETDQKETIDIPKETDIPAEPEEEPKERVIKRRGRRKVQKTPAEEVLLEEKETEEELPTTSTAQLNEKEKQVTSVDATETSTESDKIIDIPAENPEITKSQTKPAQEQVLQIPKEADIQADPEKEEAKEEVTKRGGRRKRTASESSQGSVHDDDNNANTRKGRRKVQKTPVEQTLVEEKQENQDVPSILTSDKEQTESGESETTKQASTKDEDLAEVSEETPEVADIKDSGRRKRTASESSQGSVHDDDNNTSTRKGRRKVQKIPVEETLVEENLEKQDVPSIATSDKEQIEPGESETTKEPPTKDEDFVNISEETPEHEPDVSESCKISHEETSAQVEEDMVKENPKTAAVNLPKAKDTKLSHDNVVVPPIEEAEKETNQQTTSTEKDESAEKAIRKNEVAESAEKEHTVHDVVEHEDDSANKVTESSKVDTVGQEIKTNEVALQEQKAEDAEQKDDTSSSAHSTKRGGRRKATVSESSDTEVPKSRNRSRNRKTPTETVTVSTAAELPTVVEEPKFDVIATEKLESTTSANKEDILISDESPTSLESTKSRSRSRKTPTEVDNAPTVTELPAVIEEPKDDVVEIETETSAAKEVEIANLEAKSEDVHAEQKPTKKRGKRTRTASESIQGSVADEEPTKRRVRHRNQMVEIEESKETETLDAEPKDTAESEKEQNIESAEQSLESPTTEESTNIKDHNEVVQPQSELVDEVEDHKAEGADNLKEPNIEDEVSEKPQKSSRRREAHNDQKEEQPTKSRRMRGKKVDDKEEQKHVEEIIDESKNKELPDVQNTEVNIEADDHHEEEQPTKSRRIRGKKADDKHVEEIDESNNKELSDVQITEVNIEADGDNKEEQSTTSRRVRGKKVDDKEVQKHEEEIIDESKNKALSDVQITEVNLEADDPHKEEQPSRSRRVRGKKADDKEQKHVEVIDESKNNELSEVQITEVNIEADDHHKEEQPTKSRRVRGKKVDDKEDQKHVEDESKNNELSDVQITEVNLEADDPHTSPEQKGVRSRRGRKHVVADDDDQHHETKTATKRKAAFKHVTADLEESGPVSKRRVGRRKQDHEEHEADVSHEETTHTENVSAASTKRRVGRRKQDHEQEEEEHIEETKVIAETSKHIEEKSVEPDSHEEPKKGRTRRKKDEQPELASTSHPPLDHKKQDHEEHEEEVSQEEATHTESVSVAPSKRRVGRKKQDHEEHEADISHEEITHTESASTASSKRRVGRRKQDHEEHEADVSLEETTHTESTNTASSKRRVGRRKQDHEQEEEKHIEETKVIVEESKQEKSVEPDTHEEPKKGRAPRRKKDEQSETPSASQSPERKPRGRKRKESQTDNEDHHEHSEPKSRKRKESHTDNEDHHRHSDDTKKPETEVAKLAAATSTAPQTPQRAATRRGRKASTIEVDKHDHKHIVADEDSPSKRNVPQRKASTAYHNYDETSDSDVPTKAKKKTDSPRKSLEAKPPTLATVAAAVTDSSTPQTTARGRTRKPTAKVQQFLEEERAKAETPKKRALLASVTAVTDTPTPQRMPGRRGRKASTIETEAETVGTPLASKRGRGRPVAHAEDHKETASLTEEKETDPVTTPPAASAPKGRRGGRKAKATEEDHHTEDEPPAKKSPLVLESEKQETSAAVDETTPTRTTGRRNAAAAASARIEEDALLAAVIDPPKKSRAKKAKAATATVGSTDTEAHSSEMEEEQNKKSEEEVKTKNSSSQKRDHRLASASTVDGAEELDTDEDNEGDAIKKPVNKRGGRKKPAAISRTTTDSPAVSTKRVRKAKTTDETENVVEPTTKTTRVTGRGRDKNLHCDEIIAAETTSTPQKSEEKEHLTTEEISAPAKRGTRTRRK